MKQEGGRSSLFGSRVHNRLVCETVLTGLTIDSLVLLLKEHLSFIGSSFFVQLEQEERSFSVYGSCLEHCSRSFLYYPESKGVGFVRGFNTDSVRFQKEAVIKLSSDVPFCCVGSERSLKEKSIERNFAKRTVDFSVGEAFDVGLVSENLFDIESLKSQTNLGPTSLEEMF